MEYLKKIGWYVLLIVCVLAFILMSDGVDTREDRLDSLEAHVSHLYGQTDELEDHIKELESEVEKLKQYQKY